MCRWSTRTVDPARAGEADRELGDLVSQFEAVLTQTDRTHATAQMAIDRFWRGLAGDGRRLRPHQGGAVRLLNLTWCSGSPSHAAREPGLGERPM